MRVRCAALTLVVAAWLAGAGAVTAEPLRLAQAAAVLPPFEVITIVRSLGLDPLGRPVRQGGTYVLRALDDFDREMRVVVDARSGRVLSAVPVVSSSAWRRGRDGWLDEDARLVPPRGVPGGRRTVPRPFDDDDDDDFAATPPPASAPPAVIRAPRDGDRTDSIPATRSAPPRRAAAVTPVPRPRPGGPATVSGGETQAEEVQKAQEPTPPDAAAKAPPKPAGVPVNPLW